MRCYNASHMKIIFFEASGGEEVALRRELANIETKGLEIEFTDEKFSVTRAREAEIISVFINSIVDEKAIEFLPKLKLITTRSTGFDHIAHTFAKTKGIKVATVPSYGSRTVAEFTFALMLGLSRHVFDSTRRVKNGESFAITPDLMGFDLYGKTLGIVGTGRIGQCVAQIANGFGMQVIAYDAFKNAEAAKNFHFTYRDSLNDLFSKSDIVSLHVPHLPETEHMINTKSLANFKKGALLVNTARGELCDNEAILEALDKGILGGVGLDVIEGEKKLKSSGKDAVASRLIAHPKAFVTPHLAYYSTEAEREIVKTTIGNIAGFIRGQDTNLVK